jgi:Xaa-Pro aminopeptidase
VRPFGVVDVLIYGDTERSADLRHEVPVAIGDAFLYLEADGRRAVVANALEETRIMRVVPDLELLMEDALGRGELIGEGRSPAEVEVEICVRAVSAFGIGRAVVPPGFPIALADRLRAAGTELAADQRLFSERRRRKTDAEMAGIRRAAGVAVDAMGEAAAMLREAAVDGDRLLLGREPLTAEAVRGRIREVCASAGAPAPADIIVRALGEDAPIGHDPGEGPLPAHTPIEIDLWPCDERSGCWADMSRTFVCGETSDAVSELYGLVLAAHERACAAVRPGVAASELHAVASSVFEAAGHPTQRTRKPGETLREGFYYSLGHGVGLEVHEEPLIGLNVPDRLLAGDVIAIEPGTVRRGVGGAGVEDLLVVTAGGSERLTGSFPYGLAP